MKTSYITLIPFQKSHCKREGQLVSFIYRSDRPLFLANQNDSNYTGFTYKHFFTKYHFPNVIFSI